MSGSDYSDEERLVIDEAVMEKPAAKPKRKRKPVSHVVFTDSEEEEPKPTKRASAGVEGTAPVIPTKKYKLSPKTMLGLSGPEQQWQGAMDAAVTLLTPLKVDIKELTMVPDAGTLECFRKCAQAWLSEQKIVPALTFTTVKTFQTVMARLLFDFCIKESGLQAQDWNPIGLTVWNHGCTDATGLHCLHGLPMLSKEQLIEMDINSENAQRALKENPDKVKIVTNRWKRQVVQMKNEDAACCVHDATVNAGNFSQKSCGQFYSEGPKALQAFKQIMQFQMALYPKMSTSGTHLLMPLTCFCNYSYKCLPLLGRQTCKITPFSLGNLTNLDRSLVEDPKMLASVNNPAVLVFQCCNPVYKARATAAGVNCDFKISAPDVIMAVQLAKRLWQTICKSPPKILIPEFKWLPRYQYQTVMVPVGVDDADETLY